MDDNYKLYQSNYIADNYKSFIDVVSELKLTFEGKDSTELYNTYNVFSLTSGSLCFYNLYKELTSIIRTEIPEGPLWLQSWINIHQKDTVLDWHNHYWPYHGYISIEPQDTVTEFKDYEIKNKIGQIYFGPGHRLHRVKNLSDYSGERITIGFDVTDDPIMNTDCFGFIPVL